MTKSTIVKWHIQSGFNRGDGFSSRLAYIAFDDPREIVLQLSGRFKTDDEISEFANGLVKQLNDQSLIDSVRDELAGDTQDDNENAIKSLSAKAGVTSAPKSSKIGRRRAYKKAFDLLDKTNELLLKARAAHYKATGDDDGAKKAV